MKYLIAAVALLLSINVYSQEIVVVKKQGKHYALVTDCKTTSRPTFVRVNKPEKGQKVFMKTKDRRRHSCEVKKAVEIT